MTIQLSSQSKSYNPVELSRGIIFSQKMNFVFDSDKGKQYTVPIFIKYMKQYTREMDGFTRVLIEIKLNNNLFSSETLTRPSFKEAFADKANILFPEWFEDESPSLDERYHLFVVFMNWFYSFCV